MEELSFVQRLQIIQIYYENQRSTENALKALTATWNNVSQNCQLTENIIHDVIKKFETEFSLLDIKESKGQHRDECNELNRRSYQQLSLPQRLQIIQLYYENGRSIRNVFRALRSTYGRHNRPTELTIRKTVQKFETQFSLLNIVRRNRTHPARRDENIAAVAKSVRDDRYESIRQRSQKLGISYATTWRILRKDLGLSHQELEPKNESS